MKKINLNKSLCIGCGACVAIDATHFEFDDNGLSSIIKQIETEPSSELLEAISSCPTNAISISENEEQPIENNKDEEIEVNE